MYATLLNLHAPANYNGFSTENRNFSPLSASSQHSLPASLSSTASILRPSYYSIIEDHDTYLTSQIISFGSTINTISRNKDDGALIINEYTLSSRLGKGQFGRVYKAYNNTIDDTGISSVVAIKVLGKKPMNNQQYSMNQILRQISLWKNKNMLDKDHNLTYEQVVILMNLHKIKYELFVLSKVNNSPNVIKLIQFLDSPNSSKIWSINEYCDLGELQWKRDRIETVLPQWHTFLSKSKFDHENTDISKIFVNKLAFDITSGLRYLKKNGCIHRDIKPANILLNSGEQAFKISDFGCSVIDPRNMFIRDDSEKTLLKCFKLELKKIVGTPAFIAPELCSVYSDENIKPNQSLTELTDKGDFDEYGIDMWSLGITLYCVLYNELPFLGDNEFDTYKKIAQEQLSLNPTGDKLESLLIKNILVKNPMQRISIDSLYKEVVDINSNKLTTNTSEDGDHSDKPKHFKSKAFKSEKSKKVRGLFQNIFKFSSKNSQDNIRESISNGKFVEEPSFTLPTPPTTSYNFLAEQDFSEDITNTRNVSNNQGLRTSLTSIDNGDVISVDFSEASSFGSSFVEPVNVTKYLDETPPSNAFTSELKSASPNNPSSRNHIYNQPSMSMVELTPTKKIIQEGADYSPGMRQGLSIFKQFSKSEEMLPAVSNVSEQQPKTEFPQNKKPSLTKTKLAHSKNIMNFKNILDQEPTISKKLDSIGEALDPRPSKRNTVDNFKEFKDYLQLME